MGLRKADGGRDHDSPTLPFKLTSFHISCEQNCSILVNLP